MEISIIGLSCANLPDIIKIETLSFSSPWTLDQFNKNLRNFFVALADKIIIGYIGIEKIADEIHITHMAVHPDYRRRGIGSKLVNFALQMPAKRYILEVRESNQAGRNLYNKLGFQEASRRKKYYQDNDEDALVMIYEKTSA